MFFCTDVDLLVLEPGLWGEEELGAYGLVRDMAAVVTGTALAVEGVDLAAAGVAAGMVAQVSAGGVSRSYEIVAVEAGQATVSLMRARDSSPALVPDLQGAVALTVVSLRPVIAEVGDELLAAVGIESDRAASGPALEDVSGFRAAATFGTLAKAYRVLRSGTDTAVRASRQALYEKTYGALRRALVARVDADGDEVPETVVRAAVRRLERV